MKAAVVNKQVYISARKLRRNNDMELLLGVDPRDFPELFEGLR